MTARLVLLALAAATTACAVDTGGDDAFTPDGSCYDAPDECVNPQGSHYRYIVDSIHLPDSSVEARSIALDLDGDPQGRPDNQLGAIMPSLDSVSDYTLQTILSDGIDNGSIVLLIDVQATNLQSANGVGGRMLFGHNPRPAACVDDELTDCRHHLDGNGSFDIDTTSFIDAAVAGAVSGGLFTGGPAHVALEIDLPELVPYPITLQGIGVRAQVTTGDDGRLEGIIAGGVLVDEMVQVVFPALVELVARDCTGTAPTCCAAGTLGETVLGLVDTDGDCTVSADELAANDLVQSLAAPDLDLLDADGAFNPRTDDVRETISLGASFTAVRADF